ncbi:50S ribosomal protein L24 [Candidatus Nomurabacteria bacterium]|nr:50S ribosomal protein L24 [Candidatus Nomurabacteria bacterium]
MKIKKGDNVIILTGGDKGKKGKVMKSFPTLNKIVVEGVNMKKRSKKATKKTGPGGLIEMAMPIDASNAKKVN